MRKIKAAREGEMGTERGMHGIKREKKNRQRKKGIHRETLKRRE